MRLYSDMARTAEAGCLVIGPGVCFIAAARTSNTDIYQSEQNKKQNQYHSKGTLLHRFNI
jgi:hypothetical protein